MQRDYIWLDWFQGWDPSWCYSWERRTRVWLLIFWYERGIWGVISPFLGNKILVLDMVSFRANGCFWNPQFKKDTLEFINKPLRFVSLTLFVSSFFPDLGWDMGGWVLFWGGGGLVLWKGEKTRKFFVKVCNSLLPRGQVCFVPGRPWCSFVWGGGGALGWYSGRGRRTRKFSFAVFVQRNSLGLFKMRSFLYIFLTVPFWTRYIYLCSFLIIIFFCASPVLCGLFRFFFEL